jgi:dienelactone hydrolase
MPDPTDAKRFDELILSQAKRLRQDDEPPAGLAEWSRRREALRRSMFAAMGPFPAEPCPLKPEIVNKLDRNGYHIENLIYQSRPNVWVTANLYVPADAKKNPAVLAVHGHWPGARRDPVVQARCLGLVKLGFVVLAVDAFGAGERYSDPALGTYHGALYGATLWPTGQTLLGLQVYDNRRAVDYLLTRPEVDASKIGITGASGGGNQTMYAGALDERLACVTPVCSVGQYQAYLKAACCVCEVLPGALRFTEEGDVLGLVAPRALLVINASRDAFQFSPTEAAKSVDRARRVFQLNGAEERIKHVVFDSGHDYSKSMREAMYGWMTRWLKKTGDGSPIEEPKFEIERPVTLACFPGADERPEEWLYLPTFAAQVGREMAAKSDALVPRHAEEWESSAVELRGRLRKLLGDIPKPPKPAARTAGSAPESDLSIAPLRLSGEEQMPIPLFAVSSRNSAERRPSAVILHLDGKAAMIKKPLTRALANGGWLLALPDLRATGELKPPNDAVHNALDHNSAEHAVWIGRPLLGQWVFDVLCVLDWLAIQPNRDSKRTAVIGVGQAGLVALAAAALFPERITSVATVEAPATFVASKANSVGMRMGVLAPGIMTIGDVSHLAALAAPNQVTIVDAHDSADVLLPEADARKYFTFTGSVFQALRAPDKFNLLKGVRMESLARSL